MINLAIPNLKGNEKKYLLECIEKNYVSTVGPFVEKFETMLREITGSKFAIATNTGTSALHLALRGVGVEPGDLVIAPDFSFIASANAIKQCGAEPWFMDFSTNDWGVDPIVLEEELGEHLKLSNGKYHHKSTGQHLSAILVTHAAGNPANVSELDRIASKYGLPIVYDGAAALGSTFAGQDISNYGLATTLSFNGNKTFTAGGGGCVLTNSESLADKIRHLSSTARISNQYEHDQIGFNYRITNLQAAVGLAQIEKFQEFTNRKREILSRYNEEFARYSKQTFPFCNENKTSAWMSGIILPFNNYSLIEEFKEFLSVSGIENRSFWKPMHLQKPYSNSLKSSKNQIDNFYNQIILLPNSTGLTKEDENFVVKTVHQYFSRKAH